MQKFVWYVICAFFPGFLAAAPEHSIQKVLEQFVTTKNYNSKGFGFVVKDIAENKNIVNINGEEMLNPASVSKLITAAVAFEQLGNGYVFKTHVFTSGRFDIDSGIVRGDLYIRGCGDPGFTAERLWLLVQHMHHRGLRKITGDLVLDDFYFDSVMVGPGFEEDSNSRAYESLVSALSASFNTVAIHHRSGATAGSPVIVDIFPKMVGLSISTSAKTIVSEKDASIDIKTIPTSSGTHVIVKGTRGINQAPAYTYRKVWQSWETFGGALIAQFADYGITLKGRVIHGKTPDQVMKGAPFYEFTSQPLSEFISNMFKYSSNFAAEMIFKTMSATDTVPASWGRSSEIVLQWWKSRKLPGEPVIRNGSGMGNINRLSALQVVEVLDHVWDRKSYLPEYLSALSNSGIDGTLKSRFKNSPLKGIIRGKTGTLNSLLVSTLAGYILTEDKTYAFAIFCNGVGKGQFDNWVTQENVLEKFYSLVK